MKRGFVQLKGAQFLLQARRFPLTGPLVPLTGPLFPLRGLFNCVIVGHSPRVLSAQVRREPLRISVLAGPKDYCCFTFLVLQPASLLSLHSLCLEMLGLDIGALYGISVSAGNSSLQLVGPLQRHRRQEIDRRKIRRKRRIIIIIIIIRGRRRTNKIRRKEEE